MRATLSQFFLRRNRQSSDVYIISIGLYLNFYSIILKYFLKLILTYFLILLWVLPALASDRFPSKGVPLIQNYTPAQYDNKGKVWSIDSSPNGIMYMAADKGLLEYDGKTWKSYKGSNGFTRSVLVVNDSLIYTGSDLDFGVWTRNKLQNFEYTSLYPFREVPQNINEEFWDIHQHRDHIVFISEHNLYLFRDQNITKISAPSRFSGSFAVNDAHYYADERDGLFRLTNLSLEHLFAFPDDADFELSGMYEQDGDLVLVTKNSGLFRYRSGVLVYWNTSLSSELEAGKVFSFEQIGDSHLAFGTVLRGLYVSDTNGEILHHINRQKGLSSNTILSMHFSEHGKLWLGMDYGVSWLNLSSSLTFFYDYRGDFGTGYTAVLHNNTFYLGTNQGLYQSNWENLNNNSEVNRFELIPGTEGQVWNLKVIEDELFIGHDLGLFLLRESIRPIGTKTIERLHTQSGYWTILPYKDNILAGSYNGISVFERRGNSWRYDKQIELIRGSVNQLIITEDDVLWVNIPNYGIIRAVLDANLYPQDKQIFLSTEFDGNDLQLKRVDEKVFAITDAFQYEYSSDRKEFSEYGSAEGRPEIENVLPGILEPVLLQAYIEFYPVFNGFALNFLGYDSRLDANKTVLFRTIEAFNNEDRIAISPDQTIPYRFNNLHVNFVVPNQEGVLYQYKFSSREDWSNWDTSSSFEVMNLDQGDHTLQVRAKINDEVSQITTLTLRIAPSWYHTWYAYAVYVILAISLSLIIYIWLTMSLRKQKHDLLVSQQNSLREQTEKHKQRIAQLEQVRLQSEYDDVVHQLKSKTLELANKAKENEDKNRLLLTLKEKIDAIQSAQSTPIAGLRNLNKLLDDNLSADVNTFEIQMDELHQELFKQLKSKYADLSVNDLRLCAYVKLGFSSKQIADIMNIKPSSAYINRSRLRKKLNLSPEDDLYTFLNSL